MSNEDRHRSDGLVMRILYLSDRVVDLLFTLTLLAFTVGTIYYSMNYDFETRALPVLTAVITCALLVSLLVKNRAEFLSPRDTIDEDGNPPGDEQAETRRKSVFGFLWVMLLTALVLLVGMEIGVLVFLLMYYRVQSGLSWLYTAVYSVFIWILIIVLFGFIVQVPLYEGYLMELLGIV